MFLNYCYWVCKHTQVLNQLGPYYSLKICEKSFQKCSRSHCCVCIVNNYTDMASVSSRTSPKRVRVVNYYSTVCEYAIIKHFKIKFVVTVLLSLVFLFQK